MRTLLTLSVRIYVQEYVSEFERSEVARRELMLALMASFDQRTWVQISSILVRITYGRGFAQVSSPAISEVPQPPEQAVTPSIGC